MTHIVHVNRSNSENKVADIVDLEKNLEQDLIIEADEHSQILSEDIFGDPLLVLKRQGKTSTGTRYDILALDSGGNAVIIELKRDKGRRGVETQALGYIAHLSAWKGKRFLSQFPNETQERIKTFLADRYDEDQLNLSPRIVLMARSFDRAVFALGEWLASNGVPFRCIQFRRVAIGSEVLLVFSTVFDRSRNQVFNLQFSSNPQRNSDVRREPGIFWHIIGNDAWRAEELEDEWWNFLRQRGILTASFDNTPGDSGEALLYKYIPGDRVIAYAVGKGAVGWGEVQKHAAEAYELVAENPAPFVGPRHLHRLSGVSWKACAPKLAQAILPAEFESDGPYHPIGTRASVKLDKGEWLIAKLNERFGATSCKQ